MEAMQGAYNNAKKKLTCGCSKFTVRAIKLGISLWMVADVISDGFNTKKYLDYAEVKSPNTWADKVRYSAYPLYGHQI